MSPPPLGPLAVGDLVTVDLPRHAPPGREQEGYRPAIVVGLPGASGPTRFPLVAIVPLTTDRGHAWAAANPTLYPALAAGTGGLSVASLALVDQARAIDAARVLGRRGTLTDAELAPIQAGLRALFAL